MTVSIRSERRCCDGTIGSYSHLSQVALFPPDCACGEAPTPIAHVLARMIRRATRVLVGGLLILGLAGCARTPIPEGSEGIALHPAMHGDFGHYTLALTWQPGFCARGAGCLADQPHKPLIGLHGLWASRPQDLVDADVPPQRWWAIGCDIYGGQDHYVPVRLSDMTRRALAQTVAHLRDDLVAHEYRKHVQCFGMPAENFFHTALVMRTRVADTSFGVYLRGQAGQTVTHAALLSVFRDSFHVDIDRALQLQCQTDTNGVIVLTQLWFTIRRQNLTDFPRPESFMRSPQLQDNCPARFQIPAWAPEGRQAFIHQ